MNLEKKELSRRDLIKATSLAIGGLLINNKPVFADNVQVPSPLKKEVLPKDYTQLIKQPPIGISTRQISEHLGLYEKYINSFNKINKTEKEIGINRDISINKGFAWGGIIFHELYFGNITNKPNTLHSESVLNKYIEFEFGTSEGLMNSLTEACKYNRGWVILGLNLMNQNLSIFGMDSHNEGSSFAFVWPLLVIDLYEHAYMIDYGTNKEAYIQNILKYIDWAIVEARFMQGLKNITNGTIII